MPEKNLSIIELGNRLTLQKAGGGDVDKVWEIIKADSDWLTNTKNLHHWSGYYTRDMITHKIQDQEVYLAYQSDVPVGTVTLDVNKVDYYRDEELNQFAEPKALALYVSALGVHPDRQNQGIASKLLEFTDSEARKRGIGYVRFDCRDRYTELVEFYKKRGYQIVGTTLDEEDNNEVYDLMEKKIT